MRDEGQNDGETGWTKDNGPDNCQNNGVRKMKDEPKTSRILDHRPPALGTLDPSSLPTPFTP